MSGYKACIEQFLPDALESKLCFYTLFVLAHMNNLDLSSIKRPSAAQSLSFFAELSGMQRHQTKFLFPTV